MRENLFFIAFFFGLIAFAIFVIFFGEPLLQSAFPPALESVRRIDLLALLFLAALVIKDVTSKMQRRVDYLESRISEQSRRIESLKKLVINNA